MNVLAPRAELPHPAEAPADAARRRTMGESLPRKEDERLLRGAGLFADDAHPDFLLEMAVARCPFPHARIRSINIAAAAALPGVHHILTGADVAMRTDPITVLRPVPGSPSLPYYPLALGVATHEGQAVVSVAAETRAIAEDAVDLIEIDYEPLPHVTDTLAALEPNAPALHPEVQLHNRMTENVDAAGDPDARIAAAAAVIEGRFRINRVSPLPMECRGVVAIWRRGAGVLEVRTSTQTPHLVRKQLAETLRLEEGVIRVTASDVGGAFGQKIGAFPEEFLACLHSMATARPVKWIEDRMEHFRSATHARETVLDVTLAVDAEWRISAILNDYVTDIGGWNSPCGSSQLASVVFTGPYRVYDARVRRRVTLSNKTPVGAYRGYGQPEVNFALEVLIDRLARRLGDDPLAFRRRNMLRPDELPWCVPSGAVYDNGDYLRTLEMTAEAVGYAAHRAKPSRRRADGRYVGIGLASYVERTGYASGKFLANRGSQFGAHEGVVLRANRSGGVDLYTGVSSFGQGSETAFAQMAAEVTGFHYEAIRVHAGDTATSPLNTGAFASRTVIAASGAIRDAGLAFAEKTRALAAHVLKRDAEELEIAGKAVRCRFDPRIAVPLAELFNRAILGQGLPEGMAPGLETFAQFEPKAASFAYGTAAAVVAVDAATGDFTVDRFVIAHDCGVPINPKLVEGQIRGALVQGMGALFGEELRYDLTTGQLVSGSMLDYFVPLAADVPPIEVMHTEVPSNVTTFGVRGVGESGAIPPAAAITNAICDALAEFRVEISEMPVTPERVWAALRAGSGGT
jgi:carbon-monoxide dehydrogenase large subunit